VGAPLENGLMDDLACQVHECLLEQAVSFNGGSIIFVSITELVKKFQKNHRTISRRLVALKDEGLIGTLTKTPYGTLYWVKDQDEEP